MLRRCKCRSSSDEDGENDDDESAHNNLGPPDVTKEEGVKECMHVFRTTATRTSIADVASSVLSEDCQSFILRRIQSTLRNRDKRNEKSG